MGDITLARLQELHDTETGLLEKTNTECAALLNEANERSQDTFTVQQETRFRQLTTTARRHSSRIELIEQLMQEAAMATA